MKRLFRTLFAAGSSRAVPPVVIGLFFLLYIGVAFFTDETLITLMAFTRRSLFLAALLALIPLNCALRILWETITYLKICRVLSGKPFDAISELFDEDVDLHTSPFAPELEGRLTKAGYKTGRSDNAVGAWRGISTFPARLLFLVGLFCLFTGILITTTSRTSNRRTIIEGEPIPMPGGIGGVVERITLANSSGSILAKTLTMEVASSNSGQGKRTFGLYPPSLYGGSFVYPRYLGLALYLRFSAPDMPVGYESQSSLNCYPPGKEDNVVIPGSPYRIVFTLPLPEPGSERYVSYMTGKVTLQFKLLKGKEVLFTGSAPAGGEFVRDGYRLAFPDIRRLVITDFISDYGVLFIWAAGLIFVMAGCLWLPIRFCFPRREMLFRFDPDQTRAYSRSEGGARKHAGVFHEALDLVDLKSDER
jgi:hypothetical protein